MSRADVIAAIDARGAAALAEPEIVAIAADLAPKDLDFICGNAFGAGATDAQVAAFERAIEQYVEQNAQTIMTATGTAGAAAPRAPAEPEPEPSDESSNVISIKTKATVRLSEIKKDNSDKPGGPIIRITFFEDITVEEANKPWLIKNVMAKGETSTWIAPPGAGKSGLLTSAAISLARGVDWFGFKTKERCAVAYFAFERAALVKRRLLAHRMRDGLDPDLPIAIGDQIIDLMNPRCVELLLPTIKGIEEHCGIGVGLAIFDTYNKGIAFGGGDEDKARDQNRALANLRHLQELHEALHIAVIGHTGKDEKRGSRGSNALPGDADVQNQIANNGTDVKVVTTTKANDQPEGEILRFKLEPYRLGEDDDDDPIEVWIAANEVIEVQPKSKGQTNRPIRLTHGQKIALDALVNAAAAGIPAPVSTGLPFGWQVTTLDAWKTECFRRGAITREAKNPHRDFDQRRAALQAKHLIAVDGDCVWPTKQEKTR